MGGLIGGDIPKPLPRPGRRLPYQRQDMPPVGQLFFDVTGENVQHFRRRAAHAAGIRLRAGELALLLHKSGGGRWFGGRCSSGGSGVLEVEIRLQSWGDALPNAVVLPEIVCFCVMYR